MKRVFLVLLLMLSFALVACDDIAESDAVISGIDNIEIAQGDTFDKLAGVSAVDDDDSDLTDQIVTSGFVDTNREGDYTITYSVIGSSGKSVTQVRIVTVIGNAKIKGIEDLATSIEKNGNFQPLLGVSAIDHDETDLTDQITISGDIVNEDLTIDTSATGTFIITYSVTGSNGNVITDELSLTIFEESDVSISFKYLDDDSEDTVTILMGETITLLDYAEAKDYDLASVDNLAVSFDEALNELVVDGKFTPIEGGTFVFTFLATGKNGVEVQKDLTVEVSVTGLMIDGTFVAVSQENVNNDTKPTGVVNIYTELKGMGEYGVTVIVDQYGQVIMVRSAYGAQFDMNNPIKQGDPSEIKGLPNFLAYDLYTNALWTDWTRGGADEFDGILGPQGTEGGIPEGGFAIFFPNGATRPIGLEIAREFAIKVSVIDLDIPNFNNELTEEVPSFSGIEDVTLNVDDAFDPLDGVSALDRDGNDLTVSVVFNNVDVTKGALINVPRVVNTQEGRDAYAQGWYAVVYSVTDENLGHTFYATRRVSINSQINDANINGADDILVYKDSSFDPLNGVTILDDDFTDLSDTLVVTGSVDLTIAGDYQLTYKVTGRSGVEVEVIRTITVIEADATFNAFEDGVTYKNMTFDPLEGIVAKDFDDTDISDQITYTTDLVNDVEGTYTITYSIIGTNGVSVSVDREVIVYPALVDAVIDGLSELNLPLNTELDLMEGVSATDFDGSDLTSEIVIVGSVDTSVATTYNIEYQVTGFNGNLVSQNRTIVIIESARILFDESYIDSVEVNSSFDPLLNVTAFDSDDSDLTSSITVDGNVDVNTIGTYDITYKVTGANGNEVEVIVTITVRNYPNAIINVEESYSIYVGGSIDLSALATATDYDLSEVTLTMTLPVETQTYMTGDIFSSEFSGTYDVFFQATGISGEETEVLVTIVVEKTGIVIDGTFVEVTANNIDNDSKTKEVVNIYTEFKGKGEYGVTVIVDKYGQIINVRDAYGEEIDVNNPIKQGDPANIKGIANYGSGDYADWVAGGKDSFDGLLGAQGTPGGIPEGGFGIYFGNDSAKIIRTLGLNLTREFGILVTVKGLEIPNFDNDLYLENPVFSGTEDVIITVGDSFDPLVGVSAVDNAENPLTVSVAFDNVDANSQGWYAVVYSVTDSNLGHTFSVTRRVTVVS
jgi:hypothetical protein